MVIFRSYVSLPEGNHVEGRLNQYIKLIILYNTTKILNDSGMSWGYERA